MAAEEKLGEIFVEIKAKSDELERELAILKRKVDKDAEQMGNSFSRMMKKAALAGGIIVALKQALDFSREAKNLARDAEEISSKFDTVFESIRGKANQTAKDFSKSYGLALSTTKELLAGTGDLLVGFQFTEEQALDLSERVNSLAQDLASFTNYSGGAKGASDALTKALLGETESAKSLGIVIRQDTKEFKAKVETLARTKGMTLQQAKAIAILEEAYKQSGKAVGDYARTKDSTANTERRELERLKEIKETIGQGIIPVYRIFIQLISDMASNMGDSTGSVSAFGAAMKGIATPLIIIMTMLKQIGNLVGTVGAGLAHLLLGNFSAAAGSVSMGWDIMLKDSEAMNTALYNMWSDTSKKINSLDMNPGGTNGGGGTGGAGGDGGFTANIDLLKREAALYEDIYYGTSKWYNKSIELIKAQAKEMVSAGVAKADVLKWEEQKIEELTKSYERMKITLEDLNNLKMKSQPPKQMDGISAGSKPEYFDQESQNILDIFESYKEASKFTFFDALLTSEAMAREAMAGFFDDMYLKGEWANSMLEKAFVGMANAFIGQVQRMAAEWLAFQALRATFSFFGIPIPGGAHGGSFIGTNSGVKKMAGGGSFMVPSGHPNDTYPMLLRSGEKARITPSHRVGQEEKALRNIDKSIGILNANMVDMMIAKQSDQPDAVPLYGRLDGKDIYISNKRSGKQYGRMR